MSPAGRCGDREAWQCHHPAAGDELCGTKHSLLSYFRCPLGGPLRGQAVMQKQNEWEREGWGRGGALGKKHGARAVLVLFPPR